VTHAENQRNARLPKHNSSGVVGVLWSPRVNRWRAQISKNGKQVHLGYFDCMDEAVTARKAAEIQNGFHPNHGRTPPQGERP
jgi:hypothetical protein